MIYLVRAGPTGAVKIGWSEDVKRRISVIGRWFAEEPIVLQIVEGGWEGEAVLHKRFALLRLRGEWFTYAPEMEQDLGDLRDSEQVDDGKWWLDLSPPSESLAADLAAAVEVRRRETTALIDSLSPAERKQFHENIVNRSGTHGPLQWWLP